jgi:hypothetical protein
MWILVYRKSRIVVLVLFISLLCEQEILYVMLYPHPAGPVYSGTISHGCPISSLCECDWSSKESEKKKLAIISESA